MSTLQPSRAPRRPSFSPRSFNLGCGAAWRRVCLGATLGAVASLGAGSPVLAIDVVAIEEHWELRVGAPDAASSAPQVSMLMSPYSDLNSTFFVFTLNHRNVPSFTAGGMQVQRWAADDLQQVRSGLVDSPLSQNNDVISWVQRLQLTGSELLFQVHSGNSASWGEFAGDESLRLATPTDLTNLNSYRAQISLTQSGVSFAGNRVKSLTLKKLRWIDSTGEEHELLAPIDVDTDLDP